MGQNNNTGSHRGSDEENIKKKIKDYYKGEKMDGKKLFFYLL